MFRSDRLRNLRLQLGYTHAELADMMRVGIRNIARWESGEAEPSAENIVRLGEIFSVSADYLLGTIDDPNPHMRMESLTDVERIVVAALRRGEKLEAIKAIVESA